jgi:hypothetical protein
MTDFDLLAGMRTPYTASWADSDPHANFKAEVAAHTLENPFATIENLARDTGIPVGSLIRYVLCRWASSGAEALMAMPPVLFAQMEAVVADAEAAGTVEARAKGFESLAGMVRWLRAGVEMPEWRVS